MIFFIVWYAGEINASKNNNNYFYTGKCSTEVRNKADSAKGNLRETENGRSEPHCGEETAWKASWHQGKFSREVVLIFT